jgi:multimeric flavodoxin WrbA
MNIVVIHGQTHKGNTYKATQMLLEKLCFNSEDIKEFHTTNFPQCCGCTQCILKSEELCPHYERMNTITSALDQADLIIVNSPNYCMNMTGQLKSFCDHMGYRWMSHRPFDMRNKVGVAISTTAGTGASKTTKQIKEQMIWWSVGRVYQIPVTVAAFSIDEVKKEKFEKIDAKVARIAKKINKSIKKPKPCFKTKFYFKIMSMMHKGMAWNEVETQYWKEKGWI